MKKREKQFAPVDHSKVVPAGKVLLMLGLGLLIVLPLMWIMVDNSQGEHILAEWLGVNEIVISLSAQGFYFLIFFPGQRFGYLYDFYRIFTLPPVKDIYESRILRLTYTLLSLEDQETIMEAVYSDWLDEREAVLTKDSKSGLFKVDLYYYLWFSWSIWKETRIIERKRKQSVRQPNLDTLSILPKK